MDDGAGGDGDVGAGGVDGGYLELLARGAPAEEYEAPVLAARARGVPEAGLAALEEAKLVALRVRARLERHRRREAELSALFDTAGDLAALRDLDAILTAIVRRARRLLDTDLAYLTLEDPARGDTYMRVTDGSISATFQQVRLPMGAGLGGLVAQTAAPYATDDYGEDERFRHTGPIDEAVLDEGLVAIVGVPLRIGAHALGVLFASDRRPRTFGTEEVALLGSLADHAAVAIDGARLLDETRSALDELDAASELLRVRTAAVERAASAHDRLTELVLRGGDLERLASAVREVLGGALLVVDPDGRALGRAGEPGRWTEPAGGVRAGRAVRAGDAWVAAVTAGKERLGALVLWPDRDLDEADQRILERAAMVTALLVLLGRSRADADTRVRGDLLSDLLVAAHHDPAGIGVRARRLGTDLGRPYVVLVAEGPEGLRAGLGASASGYATGRGGLATRHDGRDVLLLPGDDPGEAARAAVRGLGHRPTVGAGGPVSGPEACAGAYRDAVRCLDVLGALDRHGEGAALADLGFLGTVLGDGDLAAFVEATVGPVLAYDAQRGTDLLATLEAYFAADRSPVRAHETLHVHVNTVTQRLDRVGRLLGTGWQEPDRSLEIQLALLLHRARAG